MWFYKIDKELIKSNSEIEGDYYKYSLGKQLEISVVNSDNVNNVLTRTALELVQDSLMTKYVPNNILYFDREFIDNATFNTETSCEISQSGNRVVIGIPEKYSIKTGVLLFSGILSVNNLIQDERVVYYEKKLDWKKVSRKVSIVAAGAIGDSVYALYLITNDRGLAVGIKDTYNLGMSIKNSSVSSREGWKKFTVDNFFANNRLKIRRENKNGTTGV